MSKMGEARCAGVTSEKSKKSEKSLIQEELFNAKAQKTQRKEIVNELPRGLPQ